MKKRLFVIIPFLMVFMLNFVVYTPVSAYYSSSNLIPSHCSSTSSTITFDSNGILLIQDFVRTDVERSVMPTSDQPLIFHYFSSGTWQGQDVSALSSTRFCDQSSTVGYSHSVSIVTSGSYFVYFVQIALPVVAGDSFSFTRDYSDYCKSTAQRTIFNFLPGCSGVRKTFINSGLTTSGDSFSYTLPSDNQFYFLVFSADLYSPNLSSSNYFLFKSQSGTYTYFTDMSNLTYVASNKYATIACSNYGLSSGDSLSFKLSDGLTAYCVAGFELFLDGTSFPGLDDSEHLGGSSDDDSVGSTDLTGVHSRLDEIIALLEASGSVFTPEDFWEVYKSGLEEMFGIEDSEPTEPPPEDTTEETTEPTTSPFDVGIDEEQVDEALSYVSTDLGDTVTGSGGALSFFWFITDKFLTACDLYVVAGLSLMFCLGCWILRS